MNLMRSEFLKSKRTLMRKLLVLAPLFFLLMALPQKLLMPADYWRPWQLILDLVYNWWPLIFVPMGTALLAALAESQERKAGHYRGLRSRPLHPARLWIAKVLVMGFHTLSATLVLIAAIVLSGLITASGGIPWGRIFAGGFTVWLVSLAIIPLHLWAAAWKGTIFGMAVGLIGLASGAAAAASPYWVYVPWSWPIRLMCPIIGVHPNGTLLDAASPLRNSSVIPEGIVLSLAAFLLFTWLTAAWFSRREVR
jgi:ABC-2 type transport system permease protein